MRTRSPFRFVGLVVLASVCALSPALSQDADPNAGANAADVSGFSGARAHAHVEHLVGLGPRTGGSEAIESARGYIRNDLEALGARVETLPFEMHNKDTDEVDYALVDLVATLTDGENGTFVLATSLDTAYTESFELPGANESASGAAILLEAARLLAADPLPYGVRLLFTDGDRLFEDAPFLASAQVAQVWEAQGELDDVRLFVWVDQLCDADLQVARDANSDRRTRGFFFDAAVAERAEDAFPRGAFESVAGGHTEFRARGLRPVAALADNRLGSGDPPGALWRTTEDDLAHCDAASLETAGRVLVAGLRGAAARMRRIDGIAQPPAPAPPPVEEVEAELEETVEDAEPELTAAEAPEDAEISDELSEAQIVEEVGSEETVLEEAGVVETEAAAPDAAPAGEPDEPTRETSVPE